MKINSKSILEKVDYYIDIMLLNEQEDSEKNVSKIIDPDDECCKQDDEDDDEHKDMQILHDEDDAD